MIGIPSSFAFLFFDELDVTSLLIRYVVFAVTELVALPPRASINACSSLRLAKCCTEPVMTKVIPAKMGCLGVLRLIFDSQLC